MPEISVIIPVFNTAVLLSKCLDSILTQSFKDLELLLVDDGSTDDSYRIIQEYAETDCRIRYFHQENAGVSSARNYGLREAKGKWVAFVDSDDWLDREYFEKLWTNAEDVDFVLCGMNLIDRKGDLRPARLRTKATPNTDDDVYSLKEIYNSLNMYAFCGPICKLFRKAIIESHAIRFPEEYSFGEDSLFVAKYLRFIRKIRIVDSPLYNVQSRTGSLCAAIESPALLLDTYRNVHGETIAFCKLQGIEDISSQEAYYADRLLFCSEKMRTCPEASSLFRERVSCYEYVYHSPYKKELGYRLAPVFYFCGALHCWSLYDLFLSMAFRWSRSR